MNQLVTKLSPLYARWEGLLASLQNIFLLIIRLYWGWGFAQAGWGKFMNWEKTLGFFTSLGLPAPSINLFMAAGTELVGGICLILGLGCRVITVPLLFTMIVAYATAHKAELMGVFSDPDAFLAAPPFLFMYAVLIVLLFGPGKISLDGLLKGRLGK